MIFSTFQGKFNFQENPLDSSTFQACVNSVQKEQSAILSTFIKLAFVVMNFVLSIFEWPFYTGFTVHQLIFYWKPINRDLSKQ